MSRNIGAILKEHRINSGISVEQISNILTEKGYKASVKTIYSWENGNSNPGPDALLEMCDIYKIENILHTFGYDGYDKNGGLRLNLREREIIEKYRDLDDYGRETIDYVLERENERVALLKEKDAIISSLKENEHPIVIDMQEYKDVNKRLVEYYHSASAGGGIFVLGNEVTDHIAIPNTPENAKVDYAIKISGNSMLPDYCDGDIVLVSQKVEMHHGDVGIFIVDGKSYIKEYGETELISRNPDFENIKISEYGNIVCMGKVLGKINENI